MREDVYKQFQKQLFPIIKDCIATKDDYLKDSKTYACYEVLSTSTSKHKTKFYYNRGKTIEHIDDLAKIFEILPNTINKGNRWYLSFSYQFSA